MSAAANPGTAADPDSPDSTAEGHPAFGGDRVAVGADQVAADRLGTAVDWVLVALIAMLVAGSAVLALAFLPLHVGSVPVPISALIGVVSMILGPRACYALTGSLLAAALPVAAWFGVSVWLVLSYNTLMPRVPVTVIDGQWRVMVLLGLGSLAAAATLGLLWGDRLKARIADQQRSGVGPPPAG